MTTNLTKQKSLTFDELLIKYKGKIFEATSEELRQVRPNGLFFLFRAMRKYHNGKA